MSADAAVLTVEFKINLLAPAKGESFRFVGHVLKPGRTLTVCQAHAFARQGPNEIQVATVTGTLMAIHGRDGVVG
jgi:acyl-coenzyme A thioesterase PaaI-like protein